ncbi:uncharacterized mitochondrial protein AtMg00810-like [Lotus japonicus]|uniref:uncharacterized mitochondrial protein AtMg00810-like n=1 Tax=Lotus japonicus TaxID=34305 RepID=UPI00258CFD4C|nr:uncharacterized mitochondrial protein AtMg00810-like [Lotus japonicus]
MTLSLGYPKQQGNMACRLHKSLYGLRQASRQWFCKFSTALKHYVFHQSTSDYSLFSNGSANTLVILLVYVDDIILAGPNTALLHEVQSHLANTFRLKVLGDMKYFLGLEIARSSQGIMLTQRKYTLQLLEDTGYLACKPQPLPMDPGLKLNSSDGDLLSDVTLYRRLIGRLMYLTISHPDITYDVHKLSQFMSQPRSSHLHVVYHLIQYLKGSPGQGLMFSSSSSLRLSAFSDADWGGCLETRRSTTDYMVFLGDSLISWKSKKQATVSRSSAEAEYRALASLASELLWLRQLLKVFDIQVPSVMVFSDNISAIALATNPTSHERSKHVDIDVHFIREHVTSGFLLLNHVPSAKQLADCLTKPVAGPRLRDHMAKLGVLNIYLPT